jgi:hypothetical protein
LKAEGEEEKEGPGKRVILSPQAIFPESPAVSNTITKVLASWASDKNKLITRRQAGVEMRMAAEAGNKRKQETLEGKRERKHNLPLTQLDMK